MMTFLGFVAAILGGLAVGLVFGFKAGIDKGFEEGFEAARATQDFPEHPIGIGA